MNEGIGQRVGSMRWLDGLDEPVRKIYGSVTLN